MSTAQPAGFLNYITDEAFRRSLEADYQEMQDALTAKVWKAVHVLAGSLVETILIDYLFGRANTDPARTEVLKKDLSAAIDACKAAGVLSEENASLCTVIRQYRNLIHPGRVKRLDKRVTEDGAHVAARLVRMVADDVARKQKDTYGYTAEQVVDKILNDTDAFPAMMSSLLNKVGPQGNRT